MKIFKTITAMQLMLIGITVFANERQNELTGKIYYWQRERTTRPLGVDEFENNLSHTTTNASLAYISKQYLGMSMALGVYGAIDLNDNNPNNDVHEMNFSYKRRWDNNVYADEKDGLTYYKAQLDLHKKINNIDSKVRLGLIQIDAGVMGVNWSFLPGTYRGLQINLTWHNLELNYAIADQYKNPWTLFVDEFRFPDNVTRIKYLHTLGSKYTFANTAILEVALGEAHGYMTNYFAKISNKYNVSQHEIDINYQFYGSSDQIDDHSVNDFYSGFAWQQAVSIIHKVNSWKLQMEASWVHAPGQYGYYLPRLTSQYGSSNGRFDIWWDARSDWNHHNEKSVFAGAWYDLSQFGASGWVIGASYAFGWGGKPNTASTNAQNSRLTEMAWNIDVNYAITQGKMNGTFFKIHFTRYYNKSGQPAWGPFKNAFQDQKDVKFTLVIPFTIY